MYLLDTDVISRTSPLASSDWHQVRDWVREVGEQSYLSVVSLSELQNGATRLIARREDRRADALTRWLGMVLDLFADRFLPVDAAIARRTGELLARAGLAGHEPSFEDACIAATADLHRLMLVTQNARHFRVFGLPFQAPG